MTDEELIDIDVARALVEAAAGDVDCRRVREGVCDALVATFRAAGELLWAGGYVLGSDRSDGQSPFGFGSDATVGLAVVMQVAGALMSGTIELLAHDNLYGAAALLRQLVEVEYLTWAFAEDEQEATMWMRSSRSERLRMWQPRHLLTRSGGRFRATDYHGHCERGGHPTPDATMLLPGHGRSQSPELWRLDLAEHGVSAWRYAMDAAQRLGCQDWMGSAADAHGVSEAITHWEAGFVRRACARAGGYPPGLLATTAANRRRARQVVARRDLRAELPS